MANAQLKMKKGLQLKIGAEVRNRQQLRKTHLKEQHGLCKVCKKPLRFEQSVLGHILQKSKGGDDTLENTFAAHASCASRSVDHPA